MGFSTEDLNDSPFKTAVYMHIGVFVRLTAMLGTAVSGRSIIVPCCHRGINWLTSRRTTERSGHKHGTFRTKTSVWWRQKAAESVCEWMNEVKLHMAADGGTRCSEQLSGEKCSNDRFSSRGKQAEFLLRHPVGIFRIRRNAGPSLFWYQSVIFKGRS